jgi:hypothetical protein
LDDAAAFPSGEADGKNPGTRVSRQRMEARMNETDVDELGPVDYVVVEFPADQANFSGGWRQS